MTERPPKKLSVEDEEGRKSHIAKTRTRKDRSVLRHLR
jgi:hypothetical protein